MLKLTPTGCGPLTTPGVLNLTPEFLQCWIRINTRYHTKEKPYLINSYFFFFFFFKIGKAKKSIGWAKYIGLYVCEWEMCWRKFRNFSLVTKNIKLKRRSKIALFSNERAILKFDFHKRKQLRFSEVNYLNYTKKTQFCMWQLHFP